ncbi:amidase [Thermosporothrix hazakensis]|jgi:amidase|uniref:Amidase n=1 Tax=Thermosporothrix hazakensis TaxID=644383 RepID=A0A326U042_THEHA|nr:amidase [Thermosporothrix hazakensis]PZW22494.1 amidase [Thermosporothrix hazakensis]GCE50185.1 amidase [Thermosporothrix hazakensis]
MIEEPNEQRLQEIAHLYGLTLDEEDLAFFRQMIRRSLATYHRFDALTQSPPVTPGPRAFTRPSEAENPYNAWYCTCAVRRASEGPLIGKRIALKDTIALAGVPMMVGAALLGDYVPDEDATVVSRVLDAGGEICGKAVCEQFCFSAGSHTTDTGAVRNPRQPACSAGGSSSGCAALVAAGACDMALGGDQGGSIRVPSAWCGVYGLKPTFGLVPYTGVFPLEPTLDHVGPMAASVADVALLLDVIAGADGLDPRQSGVSFAPCLPGLTEPIDGLRVGLLREGFGWPGLSEEAVDVCVEQAALSLREVGATVEAVSLPLHRDGVTLLAPLYFEGGWMTVFVQRGRAATSKGYTPLALLAAMDRGQRERIHTLSDVAKLHLLLGHYLHEDYHGAYYARAQNCVPALTRAYDALFQQVDLLALPTTPMRACRLPEAGATREERFTQVNSVTVNTCPFNATGHPALSVPCGVIDGLPVGMMLVGRRGEDALVLRAAAAFEHLTERSHVRAQF